MNIDFNTNEAIMLTQNIKETLNQLQELTDDHFNLDPEYITDDQIEDLHTVQKWLQKTLRKAHKVSR